MASSSAETVVKAPKSRGAKANAAVAPDAAATSTVADDAQEKFFWTYTEEPHRSRRLAIIKAHPEVPLPACPCILAVTNAMSRSQNSAALSLSRNMSLPVSSLFSLRALGTCETRHSSPLSFGRLPT